MELLGVHHVSITATELEPVLAFYTDVMGLRALPRPTFSVAGAWLELPDSRQLHLIVDPRHVANVGPHFAVAVRDLDVVVAELEGRGVEVSPVAEIPTGARQCFVHDPAGNRVELHQPAVVPVG